MAEMGISTIGSLFPRGGVASSWQEKWVHLSFVLSVFILLHVCTAILHISQMKLGPQRSHVASKW